MNDEITSGADILGALLMGHAYNSWWIGSDLSIEESRRLVPHQNATTMQVAISVVAAVDVDDRESRAGRAACPTICRTTTSSRSPSRTSARGSPRRPTGRRCRTRDTTFDGYNKPDLDRKDPWQFKNFLVTDAG